jgi:putative solute:sodium symporter small subunit
MQEVGVIDRSDAACAARSHHWRRSVGWTVLGLLGWLGVTCAAAWFAGAFNRWTVAGAPAGYWLAAQGAIGAYLLIIVAYSWVMDDLDDRCQDAADAADAAPDPAPLAAAVPRAGTHG